MTSVQDGPFGMAVACSQKLTRLAPVHYTAHDPKSTADKIGIGDTIRICRTGYLGGRTLDSTENGERPALVPVPEHWRMMMVGVNSGSGIVETARAARWRRVHLPRGEEMPLLIDVRQEVIATAVFFDGCVTTWERDEKSSSTCLITLEDSCAQVVY